MSARELQDEIATLASHIYAGTCRWLELVAELDRRGATPGSSTAEWLAWRCALTPRAALAYAGYTWAPDGSLIVRARLAPEDGALFVRALEASRDRLREDDGGSAEPLRATNAQALIAMANTALAGEPAGRVPAEQYQGRCACRGAPRYVHARGRAGDRPRDSGALGLRRLSRRNRRKGRRAAFCWAEETNGSVVNTSSARGAGSPLPISRLWNRRFLHAHHVEHWAHGGETKLDNLVLLCSRHHRFVHEGGYSVIPRADRSLEFLDPWGGALPKAPRPPPGDPFELVKRNGALRIDHRTCASGTGDRMDLGLAVDALLSVTRRAKAT